MKYRGRIIILAVIVLVCGLTALFYKFRSPILVVTDEPFTLLYGEKRTKIEQIIASAMLGRLVKQVLIADSAGTDLMIIAVEEASAGPWCVVFPYRYKDAALRYNEQFPEIPVVLLTSHAVQEWEKPAVSSDSGDSGLFFEFSTDTKLDFYRVGRFSAIICGEQSGIIPVFINKTESDAGKEAFLQGFSSIKSESQPHFYDSYAQLSQNENFPLVVLAGSGTEYFDKNPRNPIILFTWLAPSYTSGETIIQMDDSLWAQLRSAVRMVKEGQKTGEIPSKPMIFSARIADNGVLRQLKKTAQSGIEPDSVEP